MLAAVCLLLQPACGGAQAVSPPVKTVALRGDEAGAQPLNGAVADRSGTVYASLKKGLYRIDLDGSYKPYAVARDCSNGFAIALPVPSQACLHEGFIENVTPRGARRIVLERPWWPADDPRYASDAAVPTYATRTANGDWHVVYGYARGVVTVRSKGAQELRRVAGSGVVRGAAFLGDRALLADERCTLTWLRHGAVTAVEDLHCGDAPRVAAAGDAFWIFGPEPGRLERRGVDGSRARWDFESDPWSVVVDPSDGTAYVVAMAREANPRTTLMTIAPGGRVTVTPLGFRGGTDAVIDARCDLWITVPLAHAFAVVTPPARAAHGCRRSRER